MAFLIYATKEEAALRSAEAWEAHLGRKKRAGDVTEFLWNVDVGKDGRAALNIDTEATRLTTQETATLVGSLSANWEKPR